jgi:hypothetical protein
MRIKTLTVVIACWAVVFFVPLSFGTENKAQEVSGNQSIAAPSAFVSEENFEFPSVLEGNDAVHTFALQNKGTAPLKIEKVKTG